jgi:putative tryptophan/tyrosine transport system substrate-binding protein
MMKKASALAASAFLACSLFALLLCSFSANAMEALSPNSLDEQHSYRVDVLQVTDIEPFQDALNGFLKALAEHDLIEGKNLIVNRVKIDFDIEKGGFWDRVGVLFRIRSEAYRIAQAKPDLVLTIGTPATKYARAILDDAHIPVVFTAVANPVDAGCPSLVDGGSGVTGATLYMDMADSLKIVRQLFPAVHKIGMVHTDDENGVANVEAAKSTAREFGVTVASREVNKRDSIVPSLKELFEQGNGVQMFAVPLDTYYGLRKFEPTIDLNEFSTEHKLPVVSFALFRMPGAVLYTGADFRTVGSLSGEQASKILKRHVKPDILPVLRQEKPTVLIDPKRVAALDIALPAALVQAKVERQDGFWQIDPGK